MLRISVQNLLAKLYDSEPKLVRATICNNILAISMIQEPVVVSKSMFNVSIEPLIDAVQLNGVGTVH